MTVEFEKWRVRLPRRWEEVVFAVLNVVRAEAWERRRMGDSVAVLNGAGSVAYVFATTTANKERIPNTYGGVQELVCWGVGVQLQDDALIGNFS